MAYFPFFVELSGLSGLIVGGGPVALRKVQKLLPYGPSLTLVAPEIIPELAAVPGLSLQKRPFLPSDLEGAAFVIAAGDPQVNREVSRLCKAKGVPVNAVDDKDACSFLFPALIRRGDLSIGVSTGGASPTAATWLKERIESVLPENLEPILAWLEACRPRVKAACPERARPALFSRLFAACLESGGPLTDAQLEALLEDASERG